MTGMRSGGIIPQLCPNTGPGSCLCMAPGERITVFHVDVGSVWNGGGAAAWPHRRRNDMSSQAGRRAAFFWRLGDGLWKARDSRQVWGGAVARFCCNPSCYAMLLRHGGIIVHYWLVWQCSSGDGREGVTTNQHFVFFRRGKSNPSAFKPCKKTKNKNIWLNCRAKEKVTTVECWANSCLYRDLTVHIAICSCCVESSPSCCVISHFLSWGSLMKCQQSSLITSLNL